MLTKHGGTAIVLNDLKDDSSYDLTGQDKVKIYVNQQIVQFEIDFNRNGKWLDRTRLYGYTLPSSSIKPLVLTLATKCASDLDSHQSIGFAILAITRALKSFGYLF